MSYRIPRVLKLGAKILVSTGFIVWLLYTVDWRGVLEHLYRVQWMGLWLYLILVVIGLFISAWKWQSIARFKHFSLPLWDAFLIYLTGTFINNFLPSFIGGDTYRAYRLRQAGGQGYAKAASTVIFDRYTGFLASIALAFFFSLFHWNAVREHPVWLWLNVGLAGILVVDVLFTLVANMPLWIALRERLPEKIQHLADELRTYSVASIMSKTLLQSGLFNMAGVGLANWILFAAFGYSVPITAFMAVIFLVSIVSSLPVSINNIGIKEWAYYTFFGMIGINAEAAVTVALVSRFIQMLLSFAAIPVYWKTKPRTISCE